jgi:hypothetical protein
MTRVIGANRGQPVQERKMAMAETPWYDAGKEAPMVIELTEQQQQAVDASPEPRLIDPRTKKAYVLIGADVYERMRELLGQAQATIQEEAWLDAVEEARNEWAQENPY